MTKLPPVRALAALAVLMVSAAVGASPAESSASGVGVASTEWKVPQGVEGKALFLTNCRVCHGVLGTPTKQALKKNEKIPNLTDPAFWARRSEDSVVAVLRNGVGPDMKSFSDKLDAPEMLAVAKYIRTFIRTP